jgi:hypothetical protein
MRRRQWSKHHLGICATIRKHSMPPSPRVGICRNLRTFEVGRERERERERENQEMARRMDVCKKARRLVPLLHAQSQRRHRSKLFDPPAPQTPRPVLRFGLPVPVVMDRASTDEKGFIMGLRHHLRGCPRRLLARIAIQTFHQPTNQPTNQRVRRPRT